MRKYIHIEPIKIGKLSLTMARIVSGVSGERLLCREQERLQLVHSRGVCRGSVLPRKREGRDV